MGIRSICFPIWKRGFTLSIWGCFYLRFHMVITSMRDLEVAKNTLPISIWRVPVRKWAGRVEYSHMGSPRFRIEFVSIWGLTHILMDFPLTLLPAQLHFSCSCFVLLSASAFIRSLLLLSLLRFHCSQSLRPRPSLPPPIRQMLS
jgi:hypothetical protein